MYLHFQYAIVCCRTVVNDNIANERLPWVCQDNGVVVVSIGQGRNFLAQCIQTFTANYV